MGCTHSIRKSGGGMTMGTLTVGTQEYNILRLLGKGKGGYSYLAEKDGTHVVLKQIHHEPCSYYTFGDKMGSELRDYQRLRDAGIRIPRMLAADARSERIVKEYIDGPTIFELVSGDIPIQPYLDQVREMARLAVAAGMNIDYFPTNFVVRDGQIYYVDYECNDYMEQWSFEVWGKQYWGKTPAFEDYLRQNQHGL